MIEFIASNWIWMLFLAAMLYMHLGHHGGHGGCGSGHSGHGAASAPGDHRETGHSHASAAPQPHAADQHRPT
jgi:hypothetical protein